MPVEISAMKPGDIYEEVMLLQVMLNKLASRYKNLPPLSPTGEFDRETEASVKALQKIFGLAATGIVDRKTWNKIASLFSAFTYND